MPKMPPKGVSKAVSKKCPECSRQMPVASRCCPCGYQFFEERRKSTTSNTSEHDDNDDFEGRSGQSISPMEGKRRSERVKREKPNFYDATEYDNKMRKARKERRREEQNEHGGRLKRERKVKNCSDFDDDDDDEPIKEKKKRKKKKTNGDKKEEEIDEDIMAGISPDLEKKFGVVLSDINAKLGFNNPLCFA